MSFFVYHRSGAAERPADTSGFGALLDELDEDPGDEEHTSVSVNHESEWSLSAYAGGYVVWENVEAGPAYHMRDVPREKIIRLWEHLARGEIEAVAREPWVEGY